MVATVAEELAAKEHKRKLAEAAAEEGAPRNAPPGKPAAAINKHANAMARAVVNEALPPENGWVMPPKKRKPGRPARSSRL